MANYEAGCAEGRYTEGRRPENQQPAFPSFSATLHPAGRPSWSTHKRVDDGRESMTVDDFTYTRSTVSSALFSRIRQPRAIARRTRYCYPTTFLRAVFVFPLFAIFSVTRVLGGAIRIDADDGRGGFSGGSTLENRANVVGKNFIPCRFLSFLLFHYTSLAYHARKCITLFNAESLTFRALIQGQLK